MELKKDDFVQLGFNPYHFVQSGDYVTVGTDDSEGFRKIQGAVGPVSEYTYPIYRLDTDKLLDRINELERNYFELLDAVESKTEGLTRHGVALNRIRLAEESDGTARST